MQLQYVLKIIRFSERKQNTQLIRNDSAAFQFHAYILGVCGG